MHNNIGLHIISLEVPLKPNNVCVTVGHPYIPG